MRLAIVILNWNGRELLTKFLPSVIKTASHISKIYVIDNASTDDSVKMLKENFPNVFVIQNSTNWGFAKGYNEGLKQIEADCFVLLNSDVEVTENWIQPIISQMDKNEFIGAYQPKILNYAIRDEFEYAGGAGGFIDKWGYPFCRGRMFDSFEKDYGQYDDEKEIFWASGACLFIRSDLFKKVGGLDEDFFAHMEEIDICWRIRNIGYKVMYNPLSVVYHVGAGTLSKSNPKKTYYNFRNNLLLICKNHSTEYLFLKLFLRGCLDGLAGLKFLFSGESNHFVAVLKAHFDFYKLLPKTLAKRNALKKSVKEYNTIAVYRGSIVWDYFVKRKRKISDLDKNLF